MTLVIDSGGTKLFWRHIKSDGSITQGVESGFHPLFGSKEDLQAIVVSIKDSVNEPINKIFYYGTGASTEAQINLIEEVFYSQFDSTQIEVNTDLLAVARALCNNRSGFACILGTGSNSCYYDGDSIQVNIPPLGYVLGDEGSGCALGKRLVKQFCRGNLPSEIASSFVKRYNLDKQDVIERVYTSSHPNQFLASFAKFLFHYLKTPFVHDLVKEEFSDFVESVLKKYSNIDSLPIHFSGSIAFYFNGILRETLVENNLTVGNIVENPIAGLALFHQDEMNRT